MEQFPLSLSLPLLCLLAGALVVLLVRQWRTTRSERQRADELEQQQWRREQNVYDLAAVRLPAVLGSVDGMRAEDPGLRHPEAQDSVFAGYLQAIADMAGAAQAAAGRRADEAAKSAVLGMASAVRSLTGEQQVALTTMQDTHDDPQVLNGLIGLDHLNAQVGRYVQGVAVMCGSWSGMQRPNTPVINVVRGAKSRVSGYKRVQINTNVADLDVAVAAVAVEPVVQTVAELIDNALRYSRRDSPVHVDVFHAYNGVTIVVDDAGVSMTPERIDQAMRVLSGREPVSILALGNPPETGFAVCGVLAAKYGFTVWVDGRSPYGGVRALVFVPNELTAPVEAPDNSQFGSAARATPISDAGTVAASARTPTADAPATTGLPRRQRRTLAVPAAAPPAPIADTDTRIPQKSAANLDSWQQVHAAAGLDTANERTIS
jgi:hypothetical protein